MQVKLHARETVESRLPVEKQTPSARTESEPPGAPPPSAAPPQSSAAPRKCHDHPERQLQLCSHCPVAQRRPAAAFLELESLSAIPVVRRRYHAPARSPLQSTVAQSLFATLRSPLMMSTIVAEPPREAGMATPSTAVKSQAPAANGTKQPASEAAPEPMDVDEAQDKAPMQKTEVVANGKAKDASTPAAAAVEVAVTRNAESAAETSRKLVERTRRRLQIQMQYVENARRKILDETHPDMAERLQVFAEERDRRLRVAQQRSEYFQRGTNVIFDYECDEANSEYELHCEKLRQDMLEEIHHEMEILNDQRKGGHTFARTTTRKTRSTRNKNGTDSNFALDTAQKIKKRAGYVFQPLENKLGQSEIDHDVRELTNIYEATKKRRMDLDTGTPRITCSKAVDADTDNVLRLPQMVRSLLWPIICGITPTELLVLSEKGKYYRLVIMDIRQGRVVLTTLSSEQAASRDDLGDASP
ncbi:unnamed protein product [Phytophthora fragariaefolia]|uniref:Unnamed protein product n=1 Tax=Phytophthora fragariaefolia TaxID=1490495 RepID=A0A9W6U1A0_9STRA|nr:unnamed protein product [Phytophthora fragariaefolia]